MTKLAEVGIALDLDVRIAPNVLAMGTGPGQIVLGHGCGSAQPSIPCTPYMLAVMPPTAQFTLRVGGSPRRTTYWGAAAGPAAFYFIEEDPSADPRGLIEMAVSNHDEWSAVIFMELEL